MPRNYEVIVVGAGPAGSTVACELATKGIKVLVLDRSTFSRYKCCAGGHTIRAASLLCRHIDDVVEDTISSTTITFAGSSPYHGTCDQSILIHRNAG